MRIEDLTPEQVEQFSACKTYDEVMAFADEIGLELDESQTKSLRNFFDDPEAFVARVRKEYTEAEDVDFTEDELKRITGGYDERGYWVVIADLCDPAKVRKKVLENSNWLNW